MPAPPPVDIASEPQEMSLPEAPIRDGVRPRRSMQPATIGAFVGRHRGAVAAVMLGLASWGAGVDQAHAQPADPPSASAVSESAEVRELTEKIRALVDTRFGGDLDAAFRHYDRRGDRALDRDELGRLLEEAGVGNFLTRGAWVSGIIEHFDRIPGAIENGMVDWPELQRALEG